MCFPENNINAYIIKNYPKSDTYELAAELNITVCALRSRANKLGVKKDLYYMHKMYSSLREKRKESFDKNTIPLELNQLEKNIIIGSLLGDGNLALYGRSKNAHYREHGGNNQTEYRKWKAEKLKNVGFKFNDKCKYGKLSSFSHSVYTNLYNLFYINKVKTITQNNISVLDHPIGLACLYMDDGSLTINVSAKNNGYIYISPQITLYTLNFSMQENLILRDHILNIFGISFNLSKRPDGKNYILKINKMNEIMRFINLVSPYVEEVKCMEYKIDIKNRLMEKKKEVLETRLYRTIKISPLEVIDKCYSNDDEITIIRMKKEGFKDKDIANTINRSFWGTVDKIRRLRQEGKL